MAMRKRVMNLRLTCKSLKRESHHPVKTCAGKLDFHALQTMYNSLLFESGASVKEAMSLSAEACKLDCLCNTRI
jgi:hypothetical protein